MWELGILGCIWHTDLRQLLSFSFKRVFLTKRNMKAKNKGENAGKMIKRWREMVVTAADT